MGVGFDLLEETALQDVQISNLLAADIVAGMLHFLLWLR